MPPSSAYVRLVASACCAFVLGACGAEPAGTPTPGESAAPAVGTAPTATPVAAATSTPTSMFDAPGGGSGTTPAAQAGAAPESMTQAARPVGPPPSLGTPRVEDAALPPPPVEALRTAPPPPAPTVAGADRERSWRVQLGAYARGSTAASIAWEGLVQRHAVLAGRTPLIGAAVGPGGRAIHRLQLAGLTRAEAADLCAALAATGDACVVVPPPHARPR